MKLISRENIQKLSKKYQQYFALFCAKQVSHLCADIPEAVRCIKLLERYLSNNDGVTKEELRDAADAAYYAATADADAAYAAAYAAIADAAYAATYAATYAAGTVGAADADAKNKIIKEQWDYYYELLNIDKNLENAIWG